MRQLLGSPRQSWLVWFSHSTPTNMTTHLRVFGNRVEFGRDFNGILCETSDLDAPLPAADPVMARHIKQYLEPLLAHANATVSDKVRQLVYELLPSGRCSVERMASSLGMDRRTLHRHLARDGETFSSIVDAARADLAQRYVKDRGRSLSEVAYVLGFSGSSAFSRWFRGKFGCSALSWRTAGEQSDYLGRRELAASGASSSACATYYRLCCSRSGARSSTPLRWRGWSRPRACPPIAPRSTR
jgi:AraC-like DNA-binding protein